MIQMLLNEDWLGVESLLALSTFVVKGRGRNEEINKERDMNTKKREKRGGTIVWVFIGTQINLLNGWI